MDRGGDRQPGCRTGPGRGDHRRGGVGGRRPAARPGPRPLPRQPDRAQLPTRARDPSGAAWQQGRHDRRSGPRSKALTVRPARAVGVDIGGTKVLAGTVDASGRVADEVRLLTPHRSKDPRVVEDTIVEAVETLRGRNEVPVVGVGAAGFVDEKGSRVLFAPHLSWRDEPLRANLEARLEVPVLLDNDANATAWAELCFGAARGFRHVICVTLGTGIGGALVMDGAVFRGAHGMAGEFGHMQV